MPRTNQTDCRPVHDERHINLHRGTPGPYRRDFVPETHHSHAAGPSVEYSATGPSLPQPLPTYPDSQIDLGRSVFDQLWSTISNTTARTTGVRPTHPAMPMDYFDNPDISVNMPLREGHAQLPPLITQYDHVVQSDSLPPFIPYLTTTATAPVLALPQTLDSGSVPVLGPGPIPPFIPYLTTATAPVFAPPQTLDSGFVPMQGPGPIPPFVPYSTIANIAPTPALPQASELGVVRATMPAFSPVAPAPRFPIGHASFTPQLAVQLTSGQKKDVLSNARRGIVMLMFTRSAVQDRSACKHLIDEALSIGLREVVGAAMVEMPKDGEREMKLEMGNVRHYFKKYCLCHVHKQFGLRLPPGCNGSEIEHRAHRVRELLSGFEFLRDHPDSSYFSSSFIEHFVLDALTLSPFSLCEFVQVNSMDNLFSLVGASIIATLHDFSGGKYEPHNVDNATWYGYYLEVKQVIIDMRQAQTSDWLDRLQTNLLARAQASLPSATD
ncbi:hypothetical protein JVT61DRAFT_10470 [Boletus reticuloceps]|uniref:Uncharacterized protein n=1 Tax=Boletus reticuloceps TaxID=495285 RepID=A0A8I3AC33_9AGAM|nr:hypothetical protein JVT61DRAFT_10470 [Boletus reticuloceps]